MKHILLLLLITCSVVARANDTLTRAQIYNFNVGDTFDYKEHITSTGCCLPGSSPVEVLDSVHYSRCVIQAIWYSANNDTLYISRAWIYPVPVKYDTLILDSLHYPEIEIDSNPYQYAQYTFDTTSLYNSTLNEEYFFCCFSDADYIFYGNGLGKVFSVVSLGEYTLYLDSISLIYYSTNTGTWGTPYYVADGSSLIHFTPIPEECASWVSSHGFDYICPSPIKVTTGARIPYMGHTYVQMEYSALNVDSSFTSDSLIGYFRNDTANAKVYLYHDTGTAPFLTYDFSVPAGGYVLYLAHVSVDGQQRTFWDEDCSGSGPIPGGYIEGVGGAAGLANFTCSYQPAGYLPDIDCYYLTCFSVCGQTLYPYDSTANCSLAAINNVTPTTAEIKVYPNLNNGVFYVEITNQSLQDAQLLITDITGREIKLCPLNNQLNNVSIEHAANGMYIWQVLSRGKLLQTGKLVKQ